MIRLDVCFGDTSCKCVVNGKAIPEASELAYASLLSYARSPECSQAGHNATGEEWHGYCCGISNYCSFKPTFVDIYYWPSVDANTSCLSIIGDSVNPWDYGATTTTTTEYGDWHGRPDNWDRIGTYWGCESDSHVITTAVMTSVNGFTFKSSMYNPWGTDNPCLALSSVVETPVSNASDGIPPLSTPAMRPRSLVNPLNSAGGTTNPPVVKVTLDGFTL